MGWIGSGAELENTLRCFNCDRDADGRFNVDGQIASFMGAGSEYVVDDSAVYYEDGKPRSLVNALKSTSYGLSVVVI